jgi:hypothetical protein
VLVLPSQRDHEDQGVKSSTQRSESWVTETDEAEKQRSRKKRRGNRRLRNHAMNAPRRNLHHRVRRRCLRTYHEARTPGDNAVSQLGRSSVRPATSWDMPSARFPSAHLRARMLAFFGLCGRCPVSPPHAQGTAEVRGGAARRWDSFRTGGHTPRIVGSAAH